MKIRWLLAAVWLAACGTPPPGALPPPSLGYRLLDPDLLAEPRPGVLRVDSSHNPNAGSNLDYNQYLRRDPDGAYVMAEHLGPGIVTRLWMTARVGTLNQSSQPGFWPESVLKVYLDGASTPSIAVNPNRFFSGAVPPFVYPLVNQHESPTGLSGKGFYSYVPISFSRSLKITLSNPYPAGAPPLTERVFYQIDVLDLAGQPPVPTSPVLRPDGSLALSPEDQAAFSRISEQWRDPASYLERAEPDASKLSFAGPVLGAARVATLMGPGRIRRLRLFTGGLSLAQLEQARLRIAWDGEASPSVDVPLGTAWGGSFVRGAFQSLIQGALPDGTLILGLPMPFRKSAVVDLLGPSGVSLPISAEVEYEQGTVSPAARYLHAVFSSEAVSGGRRFLLARASGAGHVVGLQLGLGVQNDSRALEGDEFLSTDGSSLWNGTGTEDCFNAHWFFEAGLRSLPLSGVTFIGSRLAPRISAHRFFVPDAAPFSSNFRFELENGNAPDRTDDYRSVVFYYLAHRG